jgi:DNA-binding transcriptional regulator YdaS (Cro superfamily)
MKRKKPRKLEIAAEEAVEIFSKKITLDELREEITLSYLRRGSELSSMIVLIERKEDGYHSTIYVSRKDLKKRYPK